MTKRLLAEILLENPVIPVLTIERVADAVPLARALVAGGVKALEITLRTRAAAEAAKAIAAEVPEAIVGIGTVVTPDDLQLAFKLGAHFAVSPGMTARLLAAASGVPLPLLPGVATASELMTALDQGFDTVKFFPAVPAGGIPALKALAGPFAHARFCPTGGISEATAPDWLALPNVVAVGGSWLAPADKIAAGDWAGITEIARRTSTKALAVRGKR
jgi:2-dehydro-3-deoxyphosphogluconate aldolase/(4S)-4-hydroxy-2-oxoglutarate aldolase